MLKAKDMAALLGRLDALKQGLAKEVEYVRNAESPRWPMSCRRAGRRGQKRVSFRRHGNPGAVFLATGIV